MIVARAPREVRAAPVDVAVPPTAVVDASPAIDTALPLDEVPVASASAPAPVERRTVVRPGNCRCLRLFSNGRTGLALCTQPMRPECECIGIDRARICKSLDDEGRCTAHMVYSGKDDERCSGTYEWQPNSMGTGRLHCTYCYGIVPGIAGVHGAPCVGYDTIGQRVEGRMACE